MSNNRDKIEEIENELKRMKKMPALAFALKASSAEVLLEKVVYLMHSMMADIEDIKQNGK